jgi:hypothetical protein
LVAAVEFEHAVTGERRVVAAAELGVLAPAVRRLR